MKQCIVIAALAAASALPAQAADVGVSISLGQPGFYGHIDIGEYYPRPQLIHPQPVVIVPGQALPPPIYMHVPPGHAKNWRKYCGRYGACGRPVYFVQDRWYNEVYVPAYRERHRPHEHDEHRGGPHGKRGGPHDRREEDRSRGGPPDRDGPGRGG